MSYTHAGAILSPKTPARLLKAVINKEKAESSGSGETGAGEESSPETSGKDKCCESKKDMLHRLKQYADDEKQSWQSLHAEATNFDDPKGKNMKYLAGNDFVKVDLADGTGADVDFDPQSLHFAPYTEFENVTCQARDNQSEDEEWKRVQRETAELKLQLADDFFEPEATAGCFDESVLAKVTASRNEITMRVFNELKSKLKDDSSSIASSTTSVASAASLGQLSDETEIEEETEPAPMPSTSRSHGSALAGGKNPFGETKPKVEEETEVVDLLSSDEDADDLSIICETASSSHSRSGNPLKTQRERAVDLRSQSSPPGSSQTYPMLSDDILSELIARRDQLMQLVNDVYKYSQKQEDDYRKLKDGKKYKNWKWDEDEMPPRPDPFNLNVDKELLDMLRQANEMIAIEEEKRRRQDSK